MECDKNLNGNKIETKICTVCKTELPATLEFFHAQSNGKYGVRGWCKKCNEEKRKVYASTDKAKARHAELERIRRKKMYEQDPNYYKNIYERVAEKQNKIRKEKYWNDPEYRAKKFEAEKRYKESGRRYEVGSTPEQAEKSRIRRKKRYYANPEREKEEMAKWKEKNPNYMKEKMKERLVKMPDSFIINHILRYSNLTKEDITPEMIETKRLLIQLKRECGMTAYKYNQLNKK
jgi:hypothetical protein